jgi:hypothetical protein
MTMGSVISDSVGYGMAAGLAVGIHKQNADVIRSWQDYAADLENQLAVSKRRVHALIDDYNRLAKKHNDYLAR